MKKYYKKELSQMNSDQCYSVRLNTKVSFIFHYFIVVASE
jgi:hypothetical protein